MTPESSRAARGAASRTRRSTSSRSSASAFTSWSRASRTASTTPSRTRRRSSCCPGSAGCSSRMRSGSSGRGTSSTVPRDGAHLRGRRRRAVRDPDGRRTGVGRLAGALPGVGARGSLRRERPGGDVRPEAGVRRVRAVHSGSGPRTGNSLPCASAKKGSWAGCPAAQQAHLPCSPPYNRIRSAVSAGQPRSARPVAWCRSTST